MTTVIKFEPGFRPVLKDGNTPPEGVQSAAKRALGWIADGKAGDGFTSVGHSRARQLAAGESISIETINRMKSFFSRHEVDKKALGFSQGEKGFPSHGRVAWDAWGGDAGFAWAKSVIDREVKKHLIGHHDQRTHGSWSKGQGGAGVDITEQMDKVFYSENGELNPDTQKLIETMKQIELDAGRGYGDNSLKIIAEYQGFTGKPKSVETVDDIKALQEAEGGTIVYRGLSDYSLKAIALLRDQSNPNRDDEVENAEISYSAEQGVTDFTEGEYFAGWGYFGNGTYTTTNKESAKSYASTLDESFGKMGNGKTMAIHIPASVKMPTEAEVKSIVKNMRHELSYTHRTTLSNILATKGYQAFDSGFVQKDKTGNIVILDRSMLTVAKEGA